jgi:serine/threonine protein kinase
MGSDDLLARGSVFAGSFRIVELLGAGEMGPTYLVDPLAQPRANRCVLKVMIASLTKHDVFRATFAAHAKLTWRIASPHVLQTLEAGIEPTTGRRWFTTNLLRGEDLASRVGRWGSQPLSEVRALVAALGDALGKAHPEGIVHYDLTPENIHLGTGEPSRVTLRELTISPLVSDACAAEGDIVGSAIWMPPEQFDLGRPLAPAANVWSLALLGFYAATGKPYWLHATDDPAPSRALLREILLDPMARASERAEALGCSGALPPWFDAWFARCVTRDPGRRFPDASAASTSFAESFRDGSYHLTADSEDRDDDQRTTIPLPPKPAPVRGSRRLPQGVVAEARRKRPIVSSAPPPAVSAARAPANAARAGGRGRRALLYVPVVTAAVAVLAWLWLPRHRGAQHALNHAPDGVLAAQPAATEPFAPSSSGPTSATTQAPESGPEAAAPEAVAVVQGAARPPASDGAGALAGSDVPDERNDFDLAAALKALNGIHYGVCAVSSAGKIAITFGPSGRVRRIDVLRGTYVEQARRCIAARFGAAWVTPFRGSAQTVTADLVATR